MNTAELLLPLLNKKHTGNEELAENSLILQILPHMYKEAYGAFLRLELQKYSPDTYNAMMKNVSWNDLHKEDDLVNWAKKLLNNILAYVPQEQKISLLKAIEDGEKTASTDPPTGCVMTIRNRLNQMPKVAVFGPNSRQVRIDMILATLFGEDRSLYTIKQSEWNKMQCLKRCGNPFCIHPWHLVMATSIQINHVRAQTNASSKRNSVDETVSFVAQPKTNAQFDDFQQPCSSKSLLSTTAQESPNPCLSIDTTSNWQLGTFPSTVKPTNSTITFATPDIRIVPNGNIILVPGVGVCLANNESSTQDEDVIIVDDAVTEKVVACEKLIRETDKTKETVETTTPPSSGELISAMIDKAINEHAPENESMTVENQLPPIIKRLNDAIPRGTSLPRKDPSPTVCSQNVVAESSPKTNATEAPTPNAHNEISANHSPENGSIIEAQTGENDEEIQLLDESSRNESENLPPQTTKTLDEKSKRATSASNETAGRSKSSSLCSVCMDDVFDQDMSDKESHSPPKKKKKRAIEDNQRQASSSDDDEATAKDPGPWANTRQRKHGEKWPPNKKNLESWIVGNSTKRESYQEAVRRFKMHQNKGKKSAVFDRNWVLDEGIAADMFEDIVEDLPERFPNLCGIDRPICSFEELAIFRHWTYSTFPSETNSKWTSSFKTTGFEYKIPLEFADQPLCPPNYAKITPLMFETDIRRIMPKTHSQFLIRVASNLDKYGVFSLVELLRLNIMDSLENTQNFFRYLHTVQGTVLAGRFLAAKSGVSPKETTYGIMNGLKDFKAMQKGLDTVSPHLINLLVYTSDCSPKEFLKIFEGNPKNPHILSIVIFNNGGIVDYFGLKKKYAEDLFKDGKKKSRILAEREKQKRRIQNEGIKSVNSTFPVLS